MKTCGDRVPDALVRTLIARGIQTLTPVQRAVLLAGPGAGDLLVSAPTGSGKTLAFGLALAEDLTGATVRTRKGAAPLAMVITPTRELARQVCTELSWLFGETDVRIASCTGGADPKAERRVLDAGVDLVAGSPGRLRDHVARGGLDMSGLRAVVLDEADDMLDLGFREDLEYLLAAAPDGCRMLMFSATISPRIEALARRYQQDARRIDTLLGAGGASVIRHEAILAAPGTRDTVVANVLLYHDAQAAIVFCGRREAVSDLAGWLVKHGFAVVSLSGALPQRERDAAYGALRDGRARVCVATDLAARGIDLPGLDLVIHADLPASRAAFIHRSGRTGRAGRPGRSVLIVPPGTRRRAEALGAAAGIGLRWIDAPDPQAIARRDEERALGDPVLLQPLDAREQAIAGRLLAAHAPEQVAAAFLRLRAAGRPAAAAITVASGRAPAPGRWFCLTAEQSLPGNLATVRALVARCGGIDPSDIGRIRIGGQEIRFELPARVAAAFGKAIGRGMPEGVRITPVAGGRMSRRGGVAG
jgi:ATP-dependent RNA helicase DeaD